RTTAGITVDAGCGPRRLDAAARARDLPCMSIEIAENTEGNERTDPYRNFVVVLNETQDLVNIAGAVRALLNMGLSRLRLVRPAEFDPYRIAGIAHGSEELLARCEFFDTLPDALADCVHVVGTTARRRSSSYVWQFPRQAAPELLALAATTTAPIALVF